MALVIILIMLSIGSDAFTSYFMGPMCMGLWYVGVPQHTAMYSIVSYC